MPYRPPVDLTSEQIDDAVRRYKAGEASTSIAKSFGIGAKTLRDKVLKPRGVPMNAGGRKLTPEQRDEVAERYRAGESLRALAKAFGCSPPNIKALIHSRGVESRPAHRPSVPQETLDRIRDLRAQGWSHQRIADDMGRAEHWVLTQCRRMQLPGNPAKSGPAHHAWKGGRVLHHGYAHVWIDPTDPMAVMASAHTGYAPEHRVVMARSLGRPLTRRETVHHLNGDKLDNRLENLQLRQGNHGKGVRLVCRDCGSHNIEATPL